ETFLIDRDPELLRDDVDVVDVEVDQCVGTGVALVLREIQPHAPTCDGHEPGQAGLELMLPLLLEAEAPVPLDGATRVLTVENRLDLLVRPASVSDRATRRLRAAPARCAASGRRRRRRARDSRCT